MKFQILAIFLAASTPVTSVSAQNWQLTEVDKQSIDLSIFAEKQEQAGDGLPDGLTASSASGDIRQAWYGEPTTRYRHAILGDAIEAGALMIKDANGNNQSIILRQHEVFEDRFPRIADLDFDGTNEIVTIVSDRSEGAFVAVYGLTNGKLERKAAIAPIGRSNRWLNIAGIAQFTGHKNQEIAHVETPHIGGTLYLHRWVGGELKKVAAKYGFSNHEIGAREMRLSATADINGDGLMDLIVPNDSRRSLIMISFKGGQIRELHRIKLPTRLKGPIIAEGTSEKLTFYFVLSDNRIMTLKR